MPPPTLTLIGLLEDHIWMYTSVKGGEHLMRGPHVPVVLGEATIAGIRRCLPLPLPLLKRPPYHNRIIK